MGRRSTDDALLYSEAWKEPREHFRRACWASRTHAKVAEQALEMYGDHGAQISGCVRDHFPEDVKNNLRNLARECANEVNRAWAARPKYVRKETMRRLASLIAERDGSGFYGPQPRRRRI